jgi:hypothetical protein
LGTREGEVNDSELGDTTGFSRVELQLIARTLVRKTLRYHRLQSRGGSIFGLTTKRKRQKLKLHATEVGGNSKIEQSSSSMKLNLHAAEAGGIWLKINLGLRRVFKSGLLEGCNE